MTPDSFDWQRLSDCVARLHGELDADKHIQLMFQVLRGLVPGDSIALEIFEPHAALRAVTLPQNLLSTHHLAVGGRYSHQSPFASYYRETQDASWKMTTDFMSVEEFHKLDFYRLVLTQLGGKNQIGGMLGMVDGAVHLILINRLKKGFSEAERQLLNALHPHLVTSYLNALAVTRANQSITQLQAALETTPGAYGYFSPNGNLAWLHPRAKAWLHEFFPAEIKTNDIPASVLALIKTWLRDGHTLESFTKTGATEFLRLFFSPTSLGGWMLRLERKPHQRAPRFRALRQLSPRENEVLSWMVEGKRNAEIATILNISSRTVEKQVQSILAKLDVENRATAIIFALELAAQPEEQTEGWIPALPFTAGWMGWMGLLSAV